MRQIGARVLISHDEFMHIPMKHLMDRAKQELAHRLAQELMKNMEIVERPAYQLNAKELTVELYIASPQEYKELPVLHEIKEKFSQIERIVNL